MEEPQQSGQQSQRHIYKIIVIGDSDVGKTCLTFRFCTGRFPDKTEATIGVDFRERILRIDNDEIKLQLWDTAGQERFRKSMIPHYYRNAHAIVFVYDVTNLQSFTNLTFWIDECERHSDNYNNIPRVIVGNKCDENNSQVDTNAAQRFADSHTMPLFETSAKSDNDCDNVEAIFLTLAHKLKSCKELMGPAYPSIKKATVLSVDKDLERSSSSADCMC